MRRSTRRRAAKAVASATSIRKASFARNKIGELHNGNAQEGASPEQGESQAAGEHQESRECEVAEAWRKGERQQPAAALDQGLGAGRQGARGREDPRLH